MNRDFVIFSLYAPTDVLRTLLTEYGVYSFCSSVV